MALVCGTALAGCGEDTAHVNAASAPQSNASSGAPEKGAATTQATNAQVMPALTSPTSSFNAATSISGHSAAPTSQADSVTISWAAPTENTDGSALTDLSGYEILYGANASELTEKISIGTVGLSNYVVENLSSGTWYFEVVAVNTSGFQSAPSSVVSITI